MAGGNLLHAMFLLSNTDALIVDFRQCGGGDAAMASLFLSYFYEAGAPLGGESALSYVGGPRYLGKPVYILVSHQQYSAPEAVARVMQSTKRASVVGEATRGRTNVTTPFAIDSNFSISVPYTRTTSPEGVDVSRTAVLPDVATAADQAFTGAYRAALRDANVSTDSEIMEERKAQLERMTK